jgi:hypothetical protein
MVVKLLIVVGLLALHAAVYGAVRVGTYCRICGVRYSDVVAMCQHDPRHAALSIAHVRWSWLDIAVNIVMILIGNICTK